MTPYTKLVGIPPATSEEIEEAFELLNSHVDSLEMLSRGLWSSDPEAGSALASRLKDLQLAVIILHNAAVESGEQRLGRDAIEAAEAWGASRVGADVDQYPALVVLLGNCPECLALSGEHCTLAGQPVPTHKTRKVKS